MGFHRSNFARPLSDWDAVALPKLPDGHYWRKKDAEADMRSRPGRYGFNDGAYFGRSIPIRRTSGRLVEWAGSRALRAMPWHEFVNTCRGIADARANAPATKRPNPYSRKAKP